MATRFKLGAAAAGISIAAMLAAAPAGADEVTATVLDSGAYGYRTNINNVEGDPPTKLFDLKLANGSILKVYCVQIWWNLDHDTDAMHEVPWDAYPDDSSPFVANSAKINWLLQHSYPARSLTDVAALVTATGATLHDGLDVKEAVAATQAAAWHFSDGVGLNRDDTLLDSADEDAEQDVLALYDYLTGALNVGQTQAPAPTLDLAPGDRSGASGDRIGPFTVNTTGQITDLLATVPAGVKITDKAGTVLTKATIKDGTEIYFDVPADATDGNGTIELTGSAEVPTGRLFIGKDGRKAQSLIVAGANTATLKASAGASWKLTPPTTTTTTTPPTTTPPVTTSTVPPAPQAAAVEEELAQTGVSILVPIGLGVVLLAAGVGALLYQRRRSA